MSCSRWKSPIVCREAACGMVAVEFPPLPADVRSGVTDYKKWLSVKTYFDRVLHIDAAAGQLHRIYFDLHAAAERDALYLKREAVHIDGFQTAADWRVERLSPNSRMDCSFSRVLLVQSERHERLVVWFDRRYQQRCASGKGRVRPDPALDQRASDVRGYDLRRGRKRSSKKLSPPRTVGNPRLPQRRRRLIQTLRTSKTCHRRDTDNRNWELYNHYSRQLRSYL